MATYYVRTDGSDSNTGLADDAAHAFLTVAHASSIATTSGDVIRVGAGTFNEGTNQVALGTGVKLLGASAATTIFQSAVDAAVGNHACVVPGTGSEVAFLTIAATVGGGTFQTVFGALSGDTAYTNAWLHDAILIGDTDGINGTGSLLAERVTITTKYDATTGFSGMTLELRNCTLSSHGPSEADIDVARCCPIFAQLGTVVAKDCTLTAHCDATSNDSVFGSAVTVGGKLTLINCAVSATNDNVAAGATFDLQQASTGKLWVDNLTTYSTHNGTITTLPIRLSNHNLSAYAGATIGGTYPSGSPDRASIATHVAYDNAVNLTGFASDGSNWTAVIPVSTPSGKYSVRAGDGTTLYAVGTLTILAPTTAILQQLDLP